MYLFKAEGTHGLDLGEETVESVKYRTQTPKNNDGRAVDTSATMEIAGKIRAVGDGGLTDSSIKMAQWAAEHNDAYAYQKATGTAIAGGQTLRNNIFPNAFVISYKESFDVNSGVGTFDMVLRQKKDLMESVETTGGYLSE